MRKQARNPDTNRKPQPSITLAAEDGTVLLRMTWTDGRLDVTGDETRWTEAAARFIAAMRELAEAPGQQPTAT